MCMTAAQASLAQTTIYTGEHLDEDGKTVHVTLYENTAQDLSGHGGNAMLLAVPARGKIRFLDTSGCPDILKRFRKAFPMPRTLSKSGSGDRNAVDVVRCGIYTCVVAYPGSTMRDIRRAIETRVEPENRPSIGDDYIASLRKAYRMPGSDADTHTFVIACFSNEEAAAAHPIAYAYEPIDAENLFFPGLDDHEGKVPTHVKPVTRDHLLLACSHLKTAGLQVDLSDVPAELRRFLPERFYCGEFVSGARRNGDWTLPVETARADWSFETDIKHVPPPGMVPMPERR